VSREAWAVFLQVPYFLWPRAFIGSDELIQVGHRPEPESLEEAERASAPLWALAERDEEDRQELVHPRDREPKLGMGVLNPKWNRRGCRVE
jgi:hypothetical protein